MLIKSNYKDMLLLIVAACPRSAGEIMREEKYNPYTKLTSVARALEELREGGFVSRKREAKSSGSTRLVYMVTDKGLRYVLSVKQMREFLHVSIA